MVYMMLVFAHVLAASMALGAIVATDLRLLSKLSQDRVRIAPPNEFVARMVIVALALLYATGLCMVVIGMQGRADYLQNPKLLAKLALVLLLTLNAFVLHRITFPRLARGRRVARWHVADWLLVAVPVAVSNFLWLFVAFLGIARPWNYSMPLGDILRTALMLYAAAQVGVFAVLAVAARAPNPLGRHPLDLLKRTLSSVGNLGRAQVAESEPPRVESGPPKRRRSSPHASSNIDTSVLAVQVPFRPSLRLIATPPLLPVPRRRVR